MFWIDDDMVIYLTRGDVAFFNVTAQSDGRAYMFQPGDVVRMKVTAKKDCANVQFQKDFAVEEEAQSVDILLTEAETKIGDVISKPVDYWYEIELNPRTNPQTIVGYDDDGPKILKLFPEGKDVEDLPIPEEEIAAVDSELSLTSARPVQNQVIARALITLEGEIREQRNEIISLQRCVPENPGGTWVEIVGELEDEMADARNDVDGEEHESVGEAVRSQIRQLQQQAEENKITLKESVYWTSLGLGSGAYHVINEEGYSITFSNDAVTPESGILTVEAQADGGQLIRFYADCLLVETDNSGYVVRKEKYGELKKIELNNNCAWASLGVTEYGTYYLVNDMVSVLFFGTDAISFVPTSGIISVNLFDSDKTRIDFYADNICVVIDSEGVFVESRSLIEIPENEKGPETINITNGTNWADVGPEQDGIYYLMSKGKSNLTVQGAGEGISISVSSGVISVATETISGTSVQTILFYADEIKVTFGDTYPPTTTRLDGVPEWALAPTKPTYKASEVGADPEGKAKEEIDDHNIDEAAHLDIRAFLQKLQGVVTTLLDCDDETLNQTSEIVAYVKNNKSLIESITTSKANKAGWVANKYIGTDASGNMVVKEAPNDGKDGVRGNRVTIGEASLETSGAGTNMYVMTPPLGDEMAGDIHIDQNTWNVLECLGAATESSLWELKGNIKGDPGERGEPGPAYTLTEADKEEMVNMILSAIPNAEDMTF